jgi:hypothetical protein
VFLRRHEHGIADVEVDALLRNRQTGGAVRLGVQIDKKGAVPGLGEDPGEVDRGGCLSASALLIDDRDDAHG